MDQLIQKPEKVFFPNLDGLRFFAFLCVFLSHCFIILEYEGAGPWIRVLEFFFVSGDVGVNFFFCLSGFLITYLLLSEKSEAGRINIKFFYARRVLRIWPVYFMVIFLSFLLSFLPFDCYNIKDTNFYLLFTFLINYQISYGWLSSSPIIILWSIAVEEQFYLVLPLLLILFRPKDYLKIFILIFIISIVFIYRNIHNTQAIHFHTLSVGSDLIIGCTAAYLSFHYKKFTDFFNRIKKWQIIVIYLIGFSTVFLRNTIFTNFWFIVFKGPIISLFFAFIILEQNYAVNSFFKTHRLKRATLLGKYSYGLYAYHMISITLLSLLFTHYLSLKINFVIYWFLYLASFAATCFLAITSYKLMEIKFLRLKKKFDAIRDNSLTDPKASEAKLVALPSSVN